MSDHPTPQHERRLLIDGKLVEGSAGSFDVINPATEQVIGAVGDASKADMHQAIDAARRAFDETTWSTDRAFRKECLLQLQAALEERAGGAAGGADRRGRVPPHGHPRSAARCSPDRRAPATRRSSSTASSGSRTSASSWSPLTGSNTRRKVWHEAAGVVGAIVPWNYPFEVTINKLGQALATGNTVVLKAAPDTPFNATRIGRLVAERTDIPPGVLNVITSSDHLVGEELTLSPKVDLISFTGSTAVGKRIMAKGAETMKRLFLELGGKSAAIVLDDADLGGAALLAFGVCMHAGQGCATPTRMLLPRSRYDEGVELLKTMLESVTPGDPQADDTMCGPVISAKQRDRIVGYIRSGIEEGANLVLGGPDAPDGLDTGFYVRPTLFRDVDNSMTIAREEIFGPVLVVDPVRG